MAKPRAAPANGGSGSGSFGSLYALFDPLPLFAIAAALRIALLLYGMWQDAHSAIKYTDIDYLVFTDAARFVAAGESPYARDTYRYTPLLAWLLLPTAHRRFFQFGKVVFALADLVAGWLAVRLLRGGRQGMSARRAGAFAALWLWNPMVATISTRGSSEGLLGVLTMALLWAVERRRVALAGAVLGLGVHFKIYPFIYAPAIVWWMDEERMQGGGVGSKAKKNSPSLGEAAINFVTAARVKLAVISLATFMLLNMLMYSMYVFPHRCSLSCWLDLTLGCLATARRFWYILTFIMSPVLTTDTTSHPTTYYCTSTPRRQPVPPRPRRSTPSRWRLCPSFSCRAC